MGALQLRGVKCTFGDLEQRGPGTFFSDAGDKSWEEMSKVGFYMGDAERAGRYPNYFGSHGTRAEIFLVLSGIGEDRYKRIGIFHCATVDRNPFSHGGQRRRYG